MSKRFYNIFLILFGGFLISEIIYVRIILKRDSFDLNNITYTKLLVYIFLTILFSISIISFYYTIYKIYIKKEPMNQDTKLFKIKEKIRIFLDKYGPNTAMRTFFYALVSRQNPWINYADLFLRLIQLSAPPKIFKEHIKLYYNFIYIIFVVLPKIIVSTIFVIDVFYFKHINLFYKFGILLLIPLIFKGILGTIKLYYEVNITYVTTPLIITDKEFDENGKVIKIAFAYRDDEQEKLYGPLDNMIEIYFDFKKFSDIYNYIDELSTKYIWISLYIMQIYLICFVYIIKTNCTTLFV